MRGRESFRSGNWPWKDQLSGLLELLFPLRAAALGRRERRQIRFQERWQTGEKDDPNLVGVSPAEAWTSRSGSLDSLSSVGAVHRRVGGLDGLIVTVLL